MINAALSISKENNHKITHIFENKFGFCNECNALFYIDGYPEEIRGTIFSKCNGDLVC